MKRAGKGKNSDIGPNPYLILFLFSALWFVILFGVANA